MKTAFIFHGTEGTPDENWFPWMKGKLEEKGFKVFVPQFPSPEGVPPKIDEWFEVLKNYEKEINEETILIGHSLGGVFALSVLEKLNTPVKAACLIGTPMSAPHGLEYNVNETFGGFNFDWKKIKNNAKNFIVFQSDNDPYVDLQEGEQLSKNLGVTLSFVPNAGHFNTPFGYTKFEELWEKIRYY